MPKKVTFTDETKLDNNYVKETQKKIKIQEIIKGLGFEVAPIPHVDSEVCRYMICKDIRDRLIQHILIKPQIIAKLMLNRDNVQINIYGKIQVKAIKKISYQIRDSLDLQVDMILKSNDDRFSQNLVRIIL